MPLGCWTATATAPRILRDIGRDYADLYWERYGPGDGSGSLAPTIGQFRAPLQVIGQPATQKGR
jgi:hypothetical protein